MISEKTSDKNQAKALNKTDVIGSCVFVIRDTECNSKVFGDCEICNKQVVQVFHQKRFQIKNHPIRNEKYNHFVSDCYGHYDCLIKIRKL